MNRKLIALRTAILCALWALSLSAPLAYAGPLLGSDVWAATLMDIDRDTADWTLIGLTGVPIHGMAYDANHDILYGISPSTDNIYTIDRATGAARRIGAPGVLGFGNANGLAYDTINDILWATDNNTNALLTVDTLTGVGTEVATISGGFTEIEGLAFDAATSTLYGLTQLQRRVVSIDTRTGGARAVSGLLPDLVWRGLSFDSEYRVLNLSAVAIFEDSLLYSFDPVGGRLDHRGDMIGAEAVQGLTFVPEPASVLLCCVTLPLLLTRRGR